MEYVGGAMMVMIAIIYIAAIIYLHGGGPPSGTARP